MKDRSLHALAWAYLLLLPLDIRLRGPLFLHDLLAPVFAVLIADRSTWARLRQAPGRALAAFLVLAAATTALHCRGMADFYEIAIFAYMAVLFLTFVRLSPRPVHLALYGAGVLTAMFCYSMTEIVMGMRRSYEIYEGSSLSFIAQRFFFTFEHPNLLGSFYSLPISCLALSYCKSDMKVNRMGLVILAMAILIMCIPLGLSVSRHMMISLLIVSTLIMSESPSAYSVHCRAIIKSLLASVFLLFYLTILFPFFPIGSQFPYINMSTIGMYMIHQSIYFRMSLSSIARFVGGVGRTGLHEAYPLFADRSVAYAVLSQYRQESLTDTFVTYMDAHNEYLNLAVLFGVPAMLLCVAFWLAIAGLAWRGLRSPDAVLADAPEATGGTVSGAPGPPAAFGNGLLGRCASSLLQGRRRVSHRKLAASVTLAFVLGVLLAGLWDDILSKRWIWITVGLLVGCLQRSSTDTGT